MKQKHWTASPFVPALLGVLVVAGMGVLPQQQERAWPLYEKQLGTPAAREWAAVGNGFVVPSSSTLTIDGVFAPYTNIADVTVTMLSIDGLELRSSLTLTPGTYERLTDQTVPWRRAQAGQTIQLQSTGAPQVFVYGWIERPTVHDLRILGEPAAKDWVTYTGGALGMLYMIPEDKVLTIHSVRTDGAPVLIQSNLGNVLYQTANGWAPGEVISGNDMTPRMPRVGSWVPGGAGAGGFVEMYGVDVLVGWLEDE